MGRPVRPELQWANYEARRFVMEIPAAAKKLGYPSEAAFGKEIAHGAVSLPPTPDDPIMDRVGRYMIEAADTITRLVVLAHYREEYPKPVRVQRLGVSKARYDRILERFLTGLNGWLMATR